MVRTPIDREGKEIVMRTSRELCYFCGRDASDIAELNEQVLSFFKEEIDHVTVPLTKELPERSKGERHYYSKQEWTLDHNQKMLEHLEKNADPIGLKEVKIRLPLKKQDGLGECQVSMTVWVCSVCEGSIKHFKMK